MARRVSCLTLYRHKRFGRHPCSSLTQLGDDCAEHRRAICIGQRCPRMHDGVEEGPVADDKDKDRKDARSSQS